MASNELDMQNVKSTLESENLGNSTDVEYRWAIQAGEHADVYFKLVCSVDPGVPRLTKVDEEIYAKFRRTFPDMRVDMVDEDHMKSCKGKEMWREFIESFQDKVNVFNLGTLLRINCAEGYTESNTTFCVRTQFLAIEIARNKEKHDNLCYTHGKLKDPTTGPS